MATAGLFTGGVTLPLNDGLRDLGESWNMVHPVGSMVIGANTAIPDAVLARTTSLMECPFHRFEVSR
jgi:hypothetical protein